MGKPKAVPQKVVLIPRNLSRASIFFGGGGGSECDVTPPFNSRYTEPLCGAVNEAYSAFIVPWQMGLSSTGFYSYTPPRTVLAAKKTNKQTKRWHRSFSQPDLDLIGSYESFPFLKSLPFSHFDLKSWFLHICDICYDFTFKYGLKLTYNQ